MTTIGTGIYGRCIWRIYAICLDVKTGTVTETIEYGSLGGSCCARVVMGDTMKRNDGPCS